MLAALEAFQEIAVENFVIDVIDVDLHTALEEKWGHLVPVLLDGDVEICHYFLDPDRLSGHLASLAREA